MHVLNVWYMHFQEDGNGIIDCGFSSSICYSHSEFIGEPYKYPVTKRFKVHDLVHEVKGEFYALARPKGIKPSSVFQLLVKCSLLLSHQKHIEI